MNPAKSTKLARISAAAATGRERLLAAEIRAALAAGIRGADIREALLQVYLFAGFPRAINALAVFIDVAGHPPIHREKASPPGSWRKRGEALCRKIYGRDYDPLMRRMNQLHPDLADWILVEGYGKTLSRRFLGAQERELIVIPTLAALGAWRQVPSHVQGAILCGATPREITALLARQKGVLSAASIRRASRILEETLLRLRRV